MDLTRVPFRLFRCAIAFLVLMIGVHALTPLGQPVQRIAGSAFSAETAEVSLRTSQRTAPAKAQEASRPPAPPFALPTLSAPPAILVPAAGGAAFGPGATGPPLTAQVSFSPVSPRAPPAA